RRSTQPSSASRWRFNFISAECGLTVSSSAPTPANCGAGQDIATGRLLRNRGGCCLRRADTVAGSRPNKRIQPTARRARRGGYAVFDEQGDGLGVRKEYDVSEGV